MDFNFTPPSDDKKDEKGELPKFIDEIKANAAKNPLPKKEEVKFEFASKNSSSIGVIAFAAIIAFILGWVISAQLTPKQNIIKEVCAIKNVATNPSAADLQNCGNAQTRDQPCVLYIQNTFSGNSPTKVRSFVNIATRFLKNTPYHSMVDESSIRTSNSEPLKGSEYSNYLERVVSPGAIVQLYIPAPLY